MDTIAIMKYIDSSVLGLNFSTFLNIDTHFPIPVTPYPIAQINMYLWLTSNYYKSASELNPTDIAQVVTFKCKHKHRLLWLFMHIVSWPMNMFWKWTLSNDMLKKTSVICHRYQCRKYFYINSIAREKYFSLTHHININKTKVKFVSSQNYIHRIKV